jgi:hypothetical protein
MDIDLLGRTSNKEAKIFTEPFIVYSKSEASSHSYILGLADLSTSIWAKLDILANSLTT